MKTTTVSSVRLCWIALVCACFLASAAGPASAASDRTQKDPAPPSIALAVVPFANVSEDQMADQKVMGIFVTELLATRVCIVTEPAVILSAVNDSRGRGPLDATQMKQVAEKAGVRLLLLGTITEYGQGRSSSAASVTVAIDARLVDTSTNQILWSGASNRTEVQSEGLFSNHNPSLSNVAQKVVRDLVGQIAKQRQRIEGFAPLAPAAPAAVTGAPATGGVSTTPAPATTSNVNALFLDESKQFSVQDLKGFLPAVSGMEQGEFVTSEHYGKRMETTYRVETTYHSGGGRVDVLLCDYANVDQAKAIVRARSGTAPESKFEDLPSFAPTSAFGAVRLNVAAGRFGVYLRGTPGQDDLVKKVASAILKSMR